MTADEPVLPQEVLDLLRDHIGSLEQLGALLFLRGRPSERHRVEVIAHELDLSVAAASEALHYLCREHLVDGDVDGTFQYSPADAVLATAVDQLVAVHAGNAAEVLRVMSANSFIRVRREAERMFTGALRVRRNSEAKGGKGR